MVAVLTDAKIPRNYWSDLKRRLIENEGFAELHAKIVQLKMRSPLDGKRYKTDSADAETMLRVIQSIPSPKAEPVKQWLAREGARRLDEVAAELPENQKRLLLRGEVAAQNSSLNESARILGVLTSRDFAVFHDFGDRGLYAGETAKDIAARKGLAKGQPVLDHMGSTELAANLFRITQTDDKLRTLSGDGVTGQSVANDTHYAVGREVRAAIERIGGVLPENLPTPAHSIQELERQEEAHAQARLQPPLFLPDDQGGKAE